VPSRQAGAQPIICERVLQDLNNASGWPIEKGRQAIVKNKEGSGQRGLQAIRLIIRGKPLKIVRQWAAFRSFSVPMNVLTATPEVCRLLNVINENWL
jgi:hypothetical protein